METQKLKEPGGSKDFSYICNVLLKKIILEANITIC